MLGEELEKEDGCQCFNCIVVLFLLTYNTQNFLFANKGLSL